MQEKRLSARKPKQAYQGSSFPGFDSREDSAYGPAMHPFQVDQESHLAGTREAPEDVDYSAVLQSLTNLPSHLVASAPVGKRRSRSPLPSSPPGYRSDGVVDFDLEVQKFEARPAVRETMLSEFSPAPEVSWRGMDRDGESAPFDITTAHMRLGTHRTPPLHSTFSRCAAGAAHIAIHSGQPSAASAGACTRPRQMERCLAHTSAVNPSWKCPGACRFCPREQQQKTRR
jgi:hypothetical protein